MIDKKQQKREQDRIYYRLNRERIQEKQRIWRENNKEKSREKQRQWRDKNKDRLKAKSREYYANNKEKIKQSIKLNIRKKTQWAYNYLSNNPCTDCGELDIMCLEFHHLDPNAEGNRCVASLIMSTNSMKKIQEEVEKCVVLCSNCHKKKHGMNSVRSNDMRRLFAAEWRRRNTVKIGNLVVGS